MLKLTDFEINRRGVLLRVDLETVTTPIVHLYTNNFTPDEDTVLSDLTEATFPGYNPSAWTFDLETFVAHVYRCFALANVFTRGAGGGGDMIYGYYVTDNTDTTLLWAERDPAAPLDMTIPGATYTVFPNWQATDQ